MYCHNCGQERQEDAQFCANCATKFDAVSGSKRPLAKFKSKQQQLQLKSKRGRKKSLGCMRKGKVAMSDNDDGEVFKTIIKKACNDVLPRKQLTVFGVVCLEKDKKKEKTLKLDFNIPFNDDGAGSTQQGIDTIEKVKAETELSEKIWKLWEFSQRLVSNRAKVKIFGIIKVSHNTTNYMITRNTAKENRRPKKEETKGTQDILQGRPTDVIDKNSKAPKSSNVVGTSPNQTTTQTATAPKGSNKPKKKVQNKGTPDKPAIPAKIVVAKRSDPDLSEQIGIPQGIHTAFVDKNSKAPKSSNIVETDPNQTATKIATVPKGNKRPKKKVQNKGTQDNPAIPDLAKGAIKVKTEYGDIHGSEDTQHLVHANINTTTCKPSTSAGVMIKKETYYYCEKCNHKKFITKAGVERHINKKHMVTPEETKQYIRKEEETVPAEPLDSENEYNASGECKKRKLDD